MKQVTFRKSLDRFNHIVNHENDTKFNQLVSHRRQYNKYIQMMSSAKASQERTKKDLLGQFDEKIKQKVRELQVSKSRLDTKESAAESKSPESTKRLLSFRKRRQTSLLSNQASSYKMPARQTAMKSHDAMRSAFSGEFTTQDRASNLSTTQQVRIDRAYQIQLPIGKTSYKVTTDLLIEFYRK